MGNIDRRLWLKQSSLAALGLGTSLSSLAGEVYLPKNFGSEQGLVNLGSNENPYGISPLAREAVMEMLKEANRYYFSVPSLLPIDKNIAEHFGLSEKQILLSPGSGEALHLLARHFGFGNIVTATPTFNTLPSTAKRLGTKVVEIPLTEAKVHDLPALLKAITNDTSLVYICNPANPTGTVLSPQALKDFCAEASKKTTVLIDEAYIDFLEAPLNESMIGLIDKNPNILVLRTFSKIHAMAGMRVGFLAGHPDTINKIGDNHFYGSQMCISTVAMKAAQASLADKAHQTKSRTLNAAARKYTFDQLTSLGYSPIESFTNFIYFPLKNYAGDFAGDLLKKNILVRSNNTPGNKWGRVSIGMMEEMKVFVNALK